MGKLQMPPANLLEEIVGRPIPGIDPVGTKTIRLGNRWERIYVAGYMLSRCIPGETTKQGLRDAYELYEHSGTDLLDKPGELTTTAIVAEVLMLTSIKQEQT